MASSPQVTAPTPIATARAVSDQAPIAPSQPDRPDVTNGTSLVEVGLLQIEAGVQHARMGANQQNLGTPLSLRSGLLEWLEARVSTDGFLHQSDAISSVGGLGNVQAGAKLRLFADPGGIPVLSLRSRSGRVRRVHLTLPTGLRIRRAHASHLGPALSAQLVDKTRSRAQSADVARELPSQNPSSDAESIAVRVRIDLNHDPLD